jgi:uncharacterized protein (DUF1330 family)
MGAYLLAVVNKKDLATYQQYAEAGYRSIAGFDVKVTVAEAPEVLEGHFPGTTTILLKFNSLEEAKRWYQSDLYQAAIPLRHAAGDTRFVIVFPSAD